MSGLEIFGSRGSGGQMKSRSLLEIEICMRRYSEHSKKMKMYKKIIPDQHHLLKELCHEEGVLDCSVLVLRIASGVKDVFNNKG